MQKWEYKFIDIFSDSRNPPVMIYENGYKVASFNRGLDKDPWGTYGMYFPDIFQYFNHIGGEGWEMVHTVEKAYRNTFIFKRLVAVH
jgi:hypothetical protein